MCLLVGSLISAVREVLAIFIDNHIVSRYPLSHICFLRVCLLGFEDGDGGFTFARAGRRRGGRHGRAVLSLGRPRSCWGLGPELTVQWARGVLLLALLLVGSLVFKGVGAKGSACSSRTGGAVAIACGLCGAKGAGLLQALFGCSEAGFECFELRGLCGYCALPAREEGRCQFKIGCATWESEKVRGREGASWGKGLAVLFRYGCVEISQAVIDLEEVIQSSRE